MRFKLSRLGFVLLVATASLTFALIGCGDDSVTNASTNSPPDTPGDLSPADGTTITALFADLTWSCTDPDGDTLTYDVYFGTNSSPSRVRENLTESTHKVLGLTPGRTYYWKVVARDPGGLESETEVVSFSVSS